MSKKVLFALIGIISLCLGGLIYVLFKETTYVSQVVSDLISLDKIKHHLDFFNNEFVKNYFTDFLWALSLSCFLFCIYEPNLKSSIAISGFVFLFGSLWEILQWMNCINGTGDFFDILMYFTAGITTISINQRSKRK